MCVVWDSQNILLYLVSVTDSWMTLVYGNKKMMHTIIVSVKRKFWFLWQQNRKSASCENSKSILAMFMKLGMLIKGTKEITHSIWAATWQNQQSGCVSSEDSDQPGHPPSLISVFAARMKKPWILSYPLSAQRRLSSDWADAQADLSLRWAHTHFIGFVMSWLISFFFPPDKLLWLLWQQNRRFGSCEYLKTY